MPYMAIRCSELFNRVKEAKMVAKKIDEDEILWQSDLDTEVKITDKDQTKATFTIEPLHPGYGTTLGNALRRVLLSSMPGSAVIAVKIKNVNHEFSTISGVKEDTIEIILNLKSLIVKSHSDEPQTVTLKAKGSGKVYAKNIEETGDVEIINKDLHIATLDGAKDTLEMDIVVGPGIGYVSVEEREKERLEIGMIPVDALYSPVTSVSFAIENTRVGEITNLDKLVITIETNGVITPEDAIKYAASILVNQFNLLIEPQKSKKEKDQKGAKGTEVNKMLVEELDLSPRTTNVLLNNKIKTVKDLLKIDTKEFKELKGLGNAALDEIGKKLKEFKLELKEEKNEAPEKSKKAK